MSNTNTNAEIRDIDDSRTLVSSRELHLLMMTAVKEFSNIAIAAVEKRFKEDPKHQSTTSELQNHIHTLCLDFIKALIFEVQKYNDYVHQQAYNYYKADIDKNA